MVVVAVVCMVAYSGCVFAADMAHDGWLVCCLKRAALMQWPLGDTRGDIGAHSPRYREVCVD